MKRLLETRFIVDITLIVMLVGGLVFALGFGSSLYIARNEVTKELNSKVERDMAYVQSYVDGQLQRVEDVAFTLISTKFGNSVRKSDGTSFVSIDPKTFVLPSEEEVFLMLESFLDANPQICGVAIGFEPYVYLDTKGEYGFAAYVTNVSGKNERLRLGEIHDFHAKEWYKESAKSNKPYWSRPFRETSKGKVVACYSLPLHGFGNRLVGVLALDIDTEAFRVKCNEASPFPSAEVTLVDREFNFISHPDTAYILKNVADVQIYDSYKSDDSMKTMMENDENGCYTVNRGSAGDALFFFQHMDRTGWILAVECPKKEIFQGIDDMKRTTTWIAIISILVMTICFIWLFRRMQGVTMKKASIERDLTIASAIQMGMIPKLYPAFPERKELDVCGLLKPAKSVGGDLYDYFIKNEKFFFCIGDVSGKGVPASLFMAVIRSLFRNVTLHSDKPSEIVSSLNTALSQGNDHNMFCTMFIGVLDLKNGHLEYCNAGHNAPVVRRLNEDGSVDVYYTNIDVNLAVGVFEDFPYVQGETTLNPGEAIFLYTDGVTEAENHKQVLFGEEKLLEALAEARGEGVRTAQEFVDSIFRAVVTHSHGTEQSDDITMLVVEYKGIESFRR